MEACLALQMAPMVTVSWPRGSYRLSLISIFPFLIEINIRHGFHCASRRSSFNLGKEISLKHGLDSANSGDDVS